MPEMGNMKRHFALASNITIREYIDNQVSLLIEQTPGGNNSPEIGPIHPLLAKIIKITLIPQFFHMPYGVRQHFFEFENRRL